MGTENRYFKIHASSSRLAKGLLAVPQRFNDWFPREKGPIQITFDDGDKTRSLTFHPYDPVVKESRIFGLGQWYSVRGVREGDLITVTLEDAEKRVYRISLDRYLRERRERRARLDLEAAQTDLEAKRELSTLSDLTGKRPRRLAEEELLRIAQESHRRARPRVHPAPSERHEAVPAAIRVLLGELHNGKCQLCSFTFKKRNGEPYFEVHHLDRDVGHHPTNLLVVCPNCHAQLEHAIVTDFEWAGDWLIGLAINGERLSVRQPLAHDPIKRTLLGLVVVAAALQVGRALIR